MKVRSRVVMGPRKLRRFLRGKWTLSKIARRIREGYGQGELTSYKPWIAVRDLSSRGTSTRFFSVKTGRTMQFLSDVEKNFFLYVEFREDFVDYWEQWPLERYWTAWAAEQLGVDHPRFIGTTIPFVVSIDGVLTLGRDGQISRKAVDCKYSSAIDDLRTKEKLAIAKLACEKFAYPHMVVTEESYPQQLIANIQWVRYSVRRQHEIEPVPGAFDIWPMRLHRHLLQTAGNAVVAAQTIVEFCRDFDVAQGLPKGLGLRCLKMLMWQHLVEFDMETPEPALLTVAELCIRDHSLVTAAYLDREPETR